MANDSDLSLSRPVICRIDHASQLRSDSHYLEKVPCNTCSAQGIRAPICCNVEFRSAKQCQACKRVIFPLQVEKVRGHWCQVFDRQCKPWIWRPEIHKTIGMGYGSNRIRTALTRLKTEVLAPMPRARESTTTAVKPGDLRSMRRAKRKSCQHVSTKDSQPAERTTSFVTRDLPRSRRTARSASLRLIPCFIFSSAAISRKPFSSSSRSWLTRSFRNSVRRPLAMFRRRAMNYS